MPNSNLGGPSGSRAFPNRRPVFKLSAAVIMGIPALGVEIAISTERRFPVECIWAVQERKTALSRALISLLLLKKLCEATIV